MQVKPESGKDFEEVWKSRESRLKSMPGFVRFSMLKCDNVPGKYVSQVSLPLSVRTVRVCMVCAPRWQVRRCRAECVHWWHMKHTSCLSQARHCRISMPLQPPPFAPTHHLTVHLGVQGGV